MNDYLRALCERYGVFLRSEALAVGHDDRSLAKGVRSGLFHRVRHGAYVFADTWGQLGPEARHLVTANAVVRTARAEVVLSHVTAALQLGASTWDLPLDEVHLTRADGKSGRHEAGVAQHRGLLLPEDVCEVSGKLTTSATRTAIDITTIADVEHSLVVIDSLLHLQATTPQALRERYSAMELWPGTLSTDLTLRLADGRSESAGETRSRYLFWRQALPVPIPQFEVLGRFGEVVARVDFAWPAHGVFLEFDGLEKYHRFRRKGETLEEAVLREKRREDMICELTGWRCIRITWSDLYRPEQTALRIARLLGQPVRAASW